MKKMSPEYTYETLGKILADSTAKAKEGNLDRKGKLFGIAAGYAQDFVDTSRAIKKPLDLTGRTEDNVFLCLLRVCAENIAQKKSQTENRLDMTKKFASYQLFSLVNSMNIEHPTTEIVIQASVMTSEPKLVIRSLPDKDGQTHTFDVYAAAKKTIDGLKILDPKESGGAVLFGQLAPFYQTFEKDLMNYLEGD